MEIFGSRDPMYHGHGLRMRFRSRSRERSRCHGYGIDALVADRVTLVAAKFLKSVLFKSFFLII